MRGIPLPDTSEILRAIAALHAGSDIIELRALHKRGKRVDAGCFDGDHWGLLAKEAARLNAAGAGVYVTLNEVDRQLLARYANRIQEYARATATDANVVRRRWLPVDVDPQRPKDTSATDEQLALAADRTEAVRQFLDGLGWPDPVEAESGNGYHLLYRIDLPNAAASTDLIKRCLEALAAKLDDSAIKIDRAVFNAARIIKLYGTVANKGDHIEHAPWRVSRLTCVPEEIGTVSLQQLEELASQVKPAPTGAAAKPANGLRSWTTAEMEAFLVRGNIDATGPDLHDGAQRWKLKACPFNPDHGPGESAVFLCSDGRLGFECRHNSCQDRHWRDLRSLVDGDRRPGNTFRDSPLSPHSPPLTSKIETASATKAAPEPLRRPLPPPGEYPIDALGPILGAAARRIHEVVQAPPALCGQSILAAASLAAQPHADVLIDGRRELLGLFVMTIAESGERKSSADRLALQAHREWERSRLDQYSIDLSSYQLALNAHDAAVKAVSKGKDPREIRAALEDLGPLPTAPCNPLLLVSTPTLEGIHKVVVTGIGSLGLFHDDGGEFLGGHAMNSDNRVKSAAGLSRLWDSGEFDRVRAGDGAAKHFGKRLAMHLMIQPVIAETVLSDDVLTGQGLLARTLLAWPTSNIGNREYVDVDPSTDPVLAEYRRRITALLHREPIMRPGSVNELEPRALTLTPDAKRVWIDVHNEVERDQRDGGAFATVRAWASKAPAQVLRIAGVMTLIEDPDAGVIHADTILRASALTLFHLNEAVRIVGTASVPADIQAAEALLEWCHRESIDTLHSAAALQCGPRRIRTAASFNTAVSQLERTGWALPIQGGCEIDGALRRRAWNIRGAQ
jgi:hypothetical protein